MGRRKRTAMEIAQARQREAIHPQAVYRLRELPHLLRVGRATIAEAIRSGEMQSVKRGKTRLFLGAWLLRWLVNPRTEGVGDPQDADAGVGESPAT